MAHTEVLLVVSKRLALSAVFGPIRCDFIYQATEAKNSDLTLTGEQSLVACLQLSKSLQQQLHALLFEIDIRTRMVGAENIVEDKLCRR
jgi:hypothetical protein